MSQSPKWFGLLDDDRQSRGSRSHASLTVAATSHMSVLVSRQHRMTISGMAARILPSVPVRYIYVQ